VPHKLFVYVPLTSPCALDAELLEERSGNYALVADKGVWVQQCAAEDAHRDDAEATPKDGGAVTNDRAAGHGAEVCDDLGYGDGVWAEIVLIR